MEKKLSASDAGRKYGSFPEGRRRKGQRPTPGTGKKDDSCQDALNGIIKFCMASYFFSSLSLSGGHGFSVPAKGEGIGGFGGCPGRNILL